MGEAAGGEGLRSAGAAGVVSAWVEGSGEGKRRCQAEGGERGSRWCQREWACEDLVRQPHVVQLLHGAAGHGLCGGAGVGQQVERAWAVRGLRVWCLRGWRALREEGGGGRVDDTQIPCSASCPAACI